jgi:hypothetical protein
MVLRVANRQKAFANDARNLPAAHLGKFEVSHLVTPPAEPALPALVQTVKRVHFRFIKRKVKKG